MAIKILGGNSMAVSLPLEPNDMDQYEMLYGYREIAKQNLQMVVLTLPGERVGDCNFGVGLPKYLFEPNTLSTRADISSKIREQVQEYLPYITIVDIKYHSSIEDPTVSQTYLGIKIKFKITVINTTDELNLEMDGTEVAADYLISYS